MANDFRTLDLNLQAFAEKIKVASGTVVKRVAIPLFGRIVKKTPADTGRARASWNISVNAADRSVPPEGQARYPEPTVGPLAVQPGDAIVISNNLPYITALEDGHSGQAPNGMVKVSVEEVQLMINQLMNEGLKDAGL